MIVENKNENIGRQDYEISFLIKESESVDKVLELFKKHQAEIYYQSSVNQIKLAYPIKKQTSAFFGFCYFYADPENLKKIRSDLELHPSVIRFIIITPPIKSITKQPKPQSTPRPLDTKPEQSQSTTLSNEALEQKLEEILK